MLIRPALASLVLGSLGLAIAACSKTSPPAVTPMPGPAATTTKYRLETKNETTVDLSGFGQPSQQVNFNLVSWIAVTLTDTVGGRVVHVVVDSMKYDGTTPQLSQATADSAKRGVLHGLVDPNGRVKDIATRPAQNLFLADMQGTIYGFFPKVKGSAKLGEGWSDTVEVTNTANGANVKSNFVIDYTSAGPDKAGTLPAMKVNSKTKAGVSGTMENPQAGTVEVAGTINGTSAFLVGADGRFLGGTSTATSDQTIKSAMAPGPIPLRTFRVVTVTMLP